MSIDTNLPRITQDSYALDEQFLKIAQKIFFKDSGEEDLDVSTLKTSIFGNLVQMASLITRNGVYHRNALYDEFFLNTATLDSSVYQMAKLYNYPIANATPAKCMISLAIKTNEIDSALDNLESSIINESSTNNVRVLTINKNSKFYFDDLEFMLPNSIIITRSGSGSLLSNDFNYQVSWDVEDFNLTELSETSANISSTIQTINDEKYIIMKLVLYQMDVEEQTYQCVTQDMAEVMYYSKELENQLAGFEVYIDADGITNNSIDNEFFHIKKIFNDSSEGDGNKKYCYYSFPSENKIEIFFNAYPEYRPSYGATIKMRVFNTKGKEGNVQFTGTINAEIDIMNKDENVSKIYSFDITAKCLTDPANGLNRPTIKEVKQGIIKTLLYRDGLVTTRDLQTFFDSIMNTTISGLNRNIVKFVKKRDDVLKRIYNAYLLLEDNNNHIIPTNTIHLNITPGDLENLKYRLKKGTSIIFDSVINEYRLLSNDEYPEDFIYKKKSIVYSLPYLLKVNFEPFLRCAFYRTDKSETVTTKLIYNNSLATFSNIINKISIYRNSMFQDQYNIFFNMPSNIEEKFDQTTLSSSYNNKGAYAGFKVVLVFTKNNESEDVIKAIEMDSPKKTDEDTEKWNCTLITDDIINDKGELELSYIEPNSTITNFINLPEDFRIKILVCYNESAIIDCPFFSVKKETDKLYQKYAQYIPNNYALMSIYTHDNAESVSIHKSLTTICFSDIVVKNNNYFQIKEIPVIGTKYLLDSNINEKVSNALEQIEEIFIENANTLENNTQLNIKFYNTYGASQFTNCDYVNLFIKLKIALNTNYNLTFDNKLKKAIIQFVNDSNNVGRLSLSNMIKELETTFSEIKYIDVVGINDMGLQTIVDRSFNNIDQMTKDEFRKYVPEYLNVNMQLDDGILDYSIEIEYI